MTTTARKLATDFAKEVAKRTGAGIFPADHYGIRVRNKAEANEHGYTHNALATICYEGADELMVAMTLDKRWIDRAAAAGVFFEPYATYLIAIYADDERRA